MSDFTDKSTIADNEARFYFHPRDDNTQADFYASVGAGIPSRESKFIIYGFTGGRGDVKKYNPNVNYSDPMEMMWLDCFLQGLKERGYDLTTIQFSIKKKEAEPDAKQ